MFTNTLRAGPPERKGLLRIAPQLQTGLSERSRIAGGNDQPAAGLVDDLWKCPALRLDHGDAVRKRLEKEQPFGLLIRRGHRENIDGLEECGLLRAIDFAAVLELPFEPPLAHLAPDLVEIPLVLWRQIARRHQPRGACRLALPQGVIGLAEHMQTLLGSDPGEDSRS